MKLKKRAKVITVGTIILFANIYPYPLLHSSAEEISLVENTVQLKSLTISEFQLNQTFSSDVSSYTANVSNEVERMSLRLETKDETSSVTINGEIVESGVETVLPLETGENIFHIVVTNGTETSTYTLTVIRAPNDNNQLANIMLSSGELAFEPAVTHYNVNVDSKISNITIKPKVAAETSTAKINGDVIGEKGYTMELPVGNSVVSIVVTAEDGAERTYQITINRAEEKNNSNDKDIEGQKQNPDSKVNEEKTPIQNPDNSNQTDRLDSPQQSQNNRTMPTMSGSFGTEVEEQTKANLSNLTISDGTWDNSFTSEEYTYHIAVDTDVTSVTIEGNPEENDAELTIDGIETTNSATVAIGDVAQTVISVAVTYENDRKTYVLVFDKDIDD
ncbi:cadherin-like beta sandwich domain-containing protein [Robertmurraya kyonggiensis]|uniref:Cadherin-like beta sandwich domain-containing protein n=1 Tax=Robertmurraya kyonggiensis TaxID=1037680 RepID=A0A4U1D6M9_9BACI|nr:cadherin-like beta sandwich domain-containing protein [Robertmurraya kyonggiensis]TKC18114.1 cadherin-like beta sandwich domain-containing protein [Robertmurraya kyonggiensis]